MKRLGIILGIIFVAFFGLIIYSNTNNNSKLSLDQIKQDVKNGSLLIDVRTAAEYVESHAENAINIPLEDIQNGKQPETAKDKVLYVYCKSGKRASEAKAIFEKAGFSNVVSAISLDNLKSLGSKIVE